MKDQKSTNESIGKMLEKLRAGRVKVNVAELVNNMIHGRLTGQRISNIEAGRDGVSERLLLAFLRVYKGGIYIDENTPMSAKREPTEAEKARLIAKKARRKKRKKQAGR